MIHHDPIPSQNSQAENPCRSFARYLLCGRLSYYCSKHLILPLFPTQSQHSCPSTSMTVLSSNSLRASTSCVDVGMKWIMKKEQQQDQVFDKTAFKNSLDSLAFLLHNLTHHIPSFRSSTQATRVPCHSSPWSAQCQVALGYTFICIASSFVAHASLVYSPGFTTLLQQPKRRLAPTGPRPVGVLGFKIKIQQAWISPDRIFCDWKGRFDQLCKNWIKSSTPFSILAPFLFMLLRVGIQRQLKEIFQKINEA